MEIHQVTNKLPVPRVAVAIKKVLGAFVGVEWENGFLSLEAVSPGGLSGELGSQELGDLRRPSSALLEASGKQHRSQEANLTYFESPI